MAKQVAMPGATFAAHVWDVDVVGVVAALAVEAPKAVTDANARDAVASPASVSSPRLTLRTVFLQRIGTSNWWGSPVGEVVCTGRVTSVVSRACHWHKSAGKVLVAIGGPRGRERRHGSHSHRRSGAARLDESDARTYLALLTDGATTDEVVAKLLDASVASGTRVVRGAERGRPGQPERGRRHRHTHASWSRSRHARPAAGDGAATGQESPRSTPTRTSCAPPAA